MKRAGAKLVQPTGGNFEPYRCFARGTPSEVGALLTLV